MSKSYLFNDDCVEFMRSEEFKRITDGRVVVVVTDPPFNIGYHYNEYSDRKEDAEYFRWLCGIVKGYPFVMVHYPESLYRIALELNMSPKKVVSWVYNSNTAKQHRDIAFFGITPDFRKVTQPYKNPSDKRIQRLIENGKTGARLYDLWNVNQVKNVSKEKTMHPCQMPQEVVDNIVGILPKDEKLIVFDPFLGSGTTGIACKKFGVDFIGTEISREYFEISKQRIMEVIE